MNYFPKVISFSFVATIISQAMVQKTPEYTTGLWPTTSK